MGSETVALEVMINDQLSIFPEHPAVHGNQQSLVWPGAALKAMPRQELTKSSRLS